MSLKLFTIYDSKAEAYNQPFYQKTTGMALRAIEDEMKNQDSHLSRHSSDFTLYEIGLWDEDKGTVHMFDVKKNLGVLTEFRKINENNI